MITRLLWIILVAGVAIAAQPQSPPEGPKQQPQGQNTDARRDASNNAPVTITINNQPDATKPADCPDGDCQQGTGGAWTAITAIATAVLVIVAIGGAWIAFRTLKAVETQARATEIAARVAASNAKTTEGTLLVAQSAERAYIAMSHTPHKLQFHEPGAIWFEVEVRNHGRTPGTVFGGSINILIGPYGHKTPATLTPSGTRVAVDPAFMVPNKHMRIKSIIFNLDQTQIKQATEPLDLEGPEPLDLWLAGHVDYRDGFKNYHRGGYGRHWDRNTQDLVFDQTTAALNYDRPLTPDERKQYES